MISCQGRVGINMPLLTELKKNLVVTCGYKHGAPNGAGLVVWERELAELGVFGEGLGVGTLGYCQPSLRGEGRRCLVVMGAPGRPGRCERCAEGA
jgi:hypothetical protein